MTDLSCLLAGLIWLFISPVLLFLLHRKTVARLFPAFIAFPVCLPVFLISGAIRSGFAQDDLISFCLQQGLLYGIAEEGTKYLALRFLLPSYDSMEDAAAYGIGHGAWEAFGTGLSCLGLIGSDRAAADILPVNLWAAAEGGTFGHCADCSDSVRAPVGANKGDAARGDPVPCRQQCGRRHIQFQYASCDGFAHSADCGRMRDCVSLPAAYSFCGRFRIICKRHKLSEG